MKNLKIGLLGYGTVGKGVENLLKTQENMTLHAIFRRAGSKLEPLMYDRIEDVIENPQIDVIIEAMGGLEPAHTYLKQALMNKKHIVTSNKALVNTFGDELNALANKNKVSFLFSAACGGAVPFLATLFETQKTITIASLGGILNGTTNFIIDKMERERLDFVTALNQAQTLGYAEADPSCDLNGTDSMIKLRLALAVAHQSWVDQASILVVGIENLKAVDIQVFRQRQWTLRLICFGKIGHGKTTAYVEPTLCLLESAEAKTVGNNNLAWFKSVNGDKTILTGQGAGSLPTASNVLRDLSVIQTRTERYLSEHMTTSSADNESDGKMYYVRMSKKITSDFLNLNYVERWTKDEQVYTITTQMLVKTMHQEMKLLSKQGEVFFAGIDIGVQHESL